MPPTASPNAKRARLVARPRVPALRTAHVLSATTFSSGRVMGALLWFHCVQFSSTAFSSVHPNPPCNPPVADAVTMRHRSSQGRPSFSNAFCACVCVRCFRAHHPFARLRSGTSAASSRHHATKRRGPARVRFSPTPAATKVTTARRQPPPPGNRPRHVGRRARARPAHHDMNARLAPLTLVWCLLLAGPGPHGISCPPFRQRLRI